MNFFMRSDEDNDRNTASDFIGRMSWRNDYQKSD